MTAGETLSASDERAVRDIVRQHEMAWNTGDIETLVALFAEDGVCISARGEVAEGRSAILRQCSEAWANDGVGNHATYVTERLWTAKATVALLRGRIQIRRVSGGTISSRHQRLTMVLRQSNGGLWQIVLLHETSLQVP